MVKCMNYRKLQSELKPDVFIQSYLIKYINSSTNNNNYYIMD